MLILDVADHLWDQDVPATMSQDGFTYVLGDGQTQHNASITIQ